MFITLLNYLSTRSKMYKKKVINFRNLVLHFILNNREHHENGCERDGRMAGWQLIDVNRREIEARFSSKTEMNSDIQLYMRRLQDKRRCILYISTTIVYTNIERALFISLVCCDVKVLKWLKAYTTNKQHTKKMFRAEMNK